MNLVPINLKYWVTLNGKGMSNYKYIRKYRACYAEQFGEKKINGL